MSGGIILPATFFRRASFSPRTLIISHPCGEVGNGSSLSGLRSLGKCADIRRNAGDPGKFGPFHHG
jgi:hypothetical protein